MPSLAGGWATPGRAGEPRCAPHNCKIFLQGWSQPFCWLQALGWRLSDRWAQQEDGNIRLTPALWYGREAGERRARSEPPFCMQYGNVWRTAGDITASWPEIMRVLDSSIGLMQYSIPSGWADLDMLEVRSWANWRSRPILSVNLKFKVEHTTPFRANVRFYCQSRDFKAKQ